MNKYYNGGILIYLSIIVMFIGLSIVYLLNSTGISIFQNYKADIVRSQLLHNIKSGMAIFDDAELPDFDVNNEIQIQTIEDGTITIKRNSVWTLKYWGQAIYAGFGSRDQHRITNQFTICLYFKPQTGGNPSIPLQGEALITLGHLTNDDDDFGYDAYFERYNNNQKARLRFRLAIIDANLEHWTKTVIMDDIVDGNWYFLAVTFDGNSLNIYKNAEPVQSVPAQGVVDVEFLDVPGRNSLYLGRRSTSSNAGLFKGQTTNFGIWDSALDQSAITTIFSYGFSFDPLNSIDHYQEQDNLVSFWRLNEGSGIYLHDLSVNNITGSVNVPNWGGGEQQWVEDPDSHSYFMKTEFNGFERIEPFR